LRTFLRLTADLVRFIEFLALSRLSHPRSFSSTQQANSHLHRIDQIYIRIGHGAASRTWFDMKTNFPMNESIKLSFAPGPQPAGSGLAIIHLIFVLPSV